MSHIDTPQKISDLLQQAAQETDAAPEVATNLYAEAFQLAEKESDEKSASISGWHLALLYQKQKDETQSLTYISKCLDLNYVKQNQKLCVQFHDLAATLFNTTGQYDKAMQHYFQVVTCYNAQKDKIQLAHVFNQIGETHKLLGEYSEAIRQHEKSLKIFEDAEEKEHITATLFYIGNCYNWADELDIAFNYLDKSLKIAEKLHVPELKIKPLGSLGILLTKQKKFEKAQAYFFEAIDNCNLSGNTKLKCDLLKSLGNLYNQTGQYSDALQVLLEAQGLCKQLKVKQPLHLINLFLSDAYKALNNFEKALHHFKLYHQLCKEIQNEEVSLKTRGLQLQYNVEEIKKEKVLAEQSVLLKDTFLANVSHEFRTPINGIIGMSGLLSETGVNAEQQKYIDTIKNSAFQLVDIIDDILDYARINTGQVTPVEKEIDIQKSIQFILKKLQDKSPKKTISFDTDFEENDAVIIDERNFQKIIYNILFFGCTFSSTDKITLACYHTNSKLFLNVKFNIANKKNFPNAEEIFELNNPQFTEAGLHGYGLGLSLINAKGLSQISGGKITVKTEGMQCSFVIEIPYGHVKNIKKINPPEQKEELTCITILLVEDNKINQFLARTMLEKKGHRVVLANDGEDALKKIDSETFQMVITDVQMPGMDGYELASHIRTQLKAPLNNIPIIALTAYESSIEKQKAIDAGMTAFLTKPYNPEQLFDLIQQYVMHPKVIKPLLLLDLDVHEIYNNLLSLLGGDKTEISKLVQLFNHQFPELLNEMKTSAQQQELKKLYKAAHKIKSSLKLFKIASITHSIEKIEKLAKENNATHELTVLVNELDEQVSYIVAALEKMNSKA